MKFAAALIFFTGMAMVGSVQAEELKKIERIEPKLDILIVPEKLQSMERLPSDLKNKLDELYTKLIDDRVLIEGADVTSVQPAKDGAVHVLFKACLTDTFINRPIRQTSVSIRRGKTGQRIEAKSESDGCVLWISTLDVVAEKTTESFEIKPTIFEKGSNISFDLNTTGRDRDSLFLKAYKAK